MLRRFLLSPLTSFLQSLVKPNGLPWESGGGGAPPHDVLVDNLITEEGANLISEEGDLLIAE